MLALVRVRGIVILMIGSKRLHRPIADSYYWGFNSHYDNPAVRRASAKTLLPNSPLRPINWEYPTRTILAALWNDTPRQTRETAFTLYSLAPTLEYYLGHSVVKLTGVTTEDLKKIREVKELPPHGLSIDVGLIHEDTRPEYGFRKTPLKSLPKDVDPTSTFLDFQVSLPVTLEASVDISHDGKVDIYPPVKPEADFVAYSGTVSLEPSAELYAQTRRAEVGTLAFGNGRSFGIVYDVLKATGGPEWAAFRDLFEEGGLSANQPLTNLDLIAS